MPPVFFILFNKQSIVIGLLLNSSPKMSISTEFGYYLRVFHSELCISKTNKAMQKVKKMLSDIVWKKDQLII